MIGGVAEAMSTWIKHIKDELFAFVSVQLAKDELVTRFAVTGIVLILGSLSQHLSDLPLLCEVTKRGTMTERILREVCKV